MGNKRIIGAALVAVVFTLAAVALRSGRFSAPRPDNSGIGGDWKPYALNAHTKMGDYFLVSGEAGIRLTDSEGNSPTYFRVEPGEGQIILDGPPDDLLSITIYSTEELINFGPLE